jgi:hypothetical protein
MRPLGLFVLATGLALACRASAPPAREVTEAPDYMRMLTDAAAGAAPDSFEVCAGGGYNAITVEVLDSITLKPAASGAQLVWRVGRTIDGGGAMRKYPMRQEDVAVMFGPVGRPGVYDLLVKKSGYRDWYRAGVVVRGTTEPQRLARCTITEPIHVRVLLQRARRR